MRRFTFITAIPLIVAAMVSIARTTEVGCCDTCGCNCGCQKVCRLVCEEKKVEIICWGCKCEDFCLPKHSKPGCKHCELVCQTCDQSCDSSSDLPHAKPKKFVWRDWIPGCATLHTKKKLMQKKESKTIPSFKWVVEDLCSNCEANCDCAEVPAGAELPPPPVADVPLLYRQSVAVQQ